MTRGGKQQPGADHDAVLNAIAEELWKLAPRRYRENGLVDLAFEVTHADLVAAVQRGLGKRTRPRRAKQQESLSDPVEVRAFYGYYSDDDTPTVTLDTDLVEKPERVSGETWAEAHAAAEEAIQRLGRHVDGPVVVIRRAHPQELAQIQEAIPDAGVISLFDH